MNGPTARSSPLRTPDGRYLVVRGRLWRASSPTLGPAERKRLTRMLMQARRDVGAALRGHDRDALASARRAVQVAKVALGERGPPWWDDGAPDWTRHLVGNTPYASWYATLSTHERVPQRTKRMPRA